jgi:hypothetical protein
MGRLDISDGELFMPVFCASNVGDDFKSKDIKVNDIIKITAATYNAMAGKNIPLVMIKGCEVVSQDSDKIGDPADTKDAPAAGKSEVKQEAKEEVKVKQEAGSMGSPEANKKMNQMNSPAPSGPTMTSPATTPPKPVAASPLAMSQGNENIVLITDLNPYMGRWTIKGRVVSKKAPRTIQTKNGAKKVFDLNVMDESCDIKITFWDSLCDKFHDSLEVGKCFTFSKGRLTLASSKYNDTKSQYEMTAGNDMVIELCKDEDAPALRYQFTSIERLEEMVGKVSLCICIASQTTNTCSVGVATTVTSPRKLCPAMRMSFRAIMYV